MRVGRAGSAAAALVALATSHCNCQTQKTTCQQDDECPSGYQCVNTLCSRIDDAGAGDARFDSADTVDANASDRSGADVGPTDRRRLDSILPDQSGQDRYRSDGNVDAAGLRDRPALDAGAFVEQCGTLGVFGDDFETGLQRFWNVDAESRGEVLPEVIAGKMTISVPAGATNWWSSVVTLAKASLRHGRMSVEVEAPTGSDTQNTWTYFNFSGEDGGYIQLVLYAGNLLAYCGDASCMTAEQLLAPYNPVAHRWWQIRGTDDAVFFEASRDGIEYVNLYTIAPPSFLDRGYLKIGSGIGVGEPNTATAVIKFDNLNCDSGGARRAVDWCLAASLQEAFDGEPGFEWSLHDPNHHCTFGYNPQLMISAPPGGVPVCSLATTTAYELANSAVEVQVSQVPTADGAIAGIFLTEQVFGGSRIEFGYRAGYLEVWSDNFGSCNHEVVSADQDMLRVSYDGSILLFEIGTANPPSWNANSFSCSVSDLGPVQIDIGLRPSFPSSLNYQTATFDDYNRLP